MPPAELSGMGPFYPAFEPLAGHAVSLPPFVPIPASVAEIMAPPADADLAEQHQRLTEFIVQFEQHTQPHPPHPVLGPLTRDEWMGFHLRHCERHLSFVRVE